MGAAKSPFLAIDSADSSGSARTSHGQCNGFLGPVACPPVGNAPQGTLHLPLFDLSHGRAVLGTIDLDRELDPAVLRFVHHEVEMGCRAPFFTIGFSKASHTYGRTLYT